MRRRDLGELWIAWDELEWPYVSTRRRPSLVAELLGRLVVALVVLAYLAAVAGAVYLIASAVA